MNQEDKQNQILEKLIIEYVEYKASFQDEEQIKNILNLHLGSITLPSIFKKFKKLWKNELQEANIKNICIYYFLCTLKNKTYEYLENQKMKDKK